MDIDKEIEELTVIHNYAGRRLRELKVRRAYMNGTKLVSAEPLIPIIRQWIDSGKSIGQLANTVLINENTIRRILRGAQTTVRDSTADQFFTRLGMTQEYSEAYPLPEPPPSQYYEE